MHVVDVQKEERGLALRKPLNPGAPGLEHMLGIDCEYVWWNHESYEDKTVGIWSLIIPMNDEDMVSDWTDNERFEEAYQLFRSRI